MTGTVTDEKRPASTPQAVALRFDKQRLKLCGWAAPAEADHAADELVLSLMAGEVLLGTLRRDLARPDVDVHLGYAGPPCGFSVPDFGLRTFARITGLRDLAITTSGVGVDAVRHAMPTGERDDEQVDPLGSRGTVLKGIKLTDLWLESSRDLSLRFEATRQATRFIDAYQCTPGADPILVNLAAQQRVGGQLSIARVKLLNPFLPLLLVFKADDGAIDGIDLIPFPSLARGGLHEAERLVGGDGSDDLTDTVTVSAALLQALLTRGERTSDGVGCVVLDPAIHTGLEPVLNDDVLGWISDFLGIAIRLPRPESGDTPDFIATRLARHVGGTDRDGHRLHLPADCVPTIAALVHGCPNGLAAQTVSGSRLVVEWNRHGHIWSVWQPPIGDWLDGFQGMATRRVAPALEVRSDGADAADGQAIALEWPLAIAIREMATRVGQTSPFEMATDMMLPLLRNGALPSGSGISVVILCDSADQSVVALLESLARQQSVGVIDVIVSRATTKADPLLSDALATLFPDRHRVVALPAATGRLDRIKAVCDSLAQEQVLIVDAATLLPDPRTIATLLPMLDAPDVATVGCLVRAGHGKPVALSAGYAPTAVNLRAVPALSFASIDAAALGQPATYAVVANSTAALVTTRSLLRDATAHGSSSFRPAVDDLLLGLQAIERGDYNLCTTLVSVFSDREAAMTTDLAVSIPYRLSTEAIGRIMAATTIVQTIR